MPPPMTQLYSSLLCHDGDGMADKRSTPSCYPLGRIVINLWLKSLRVL
jgi:hypothetical protein